jgi:hypothetical protein
MVRCGYGEFNAEGKEGEEDADGEFFVGTLEL